MAVAKWGYESVVKNGGSTWVCPSSFEKIDEIRL